MPYLHQGRHLLDGHAVEEVDGVPVTVLALDVDEHPDGSGGASQLGTVEVWG